MGVFEITAPDGKVFEIEGENAQGALAALQKHLGAPPAAPAMQAEAVSDASTVAAQRLSRGVRNASRASMVGTEAERMGKFADDSVRAIANGMTFGVADKFAGGMNAITGQAPSYDEGVKAERARTAALPEGQKIAGEVIGGLTTGVGLANSGVTLAGRVGPRLLPRVLGYGAEGAAYGAAHGAGNTYSEKPSDYIENAKQGATTGALIGGGLPLAGAAAGGAYRLGSAFLGPRVEGAGRGASAMLRGAAQADEAGLRGLPGMGPEAMLVDAGPAMKGLGQGAGTGTGEGRTKLVNALIERDKNTGNRLNTAVNENFGVAPTPSRVEAGLAQARQDLAPAYEQVFQGAQPVNTRALADQLNAIAVAERGPAQRAARQVREMLNDPVATRELSRDPASLLNTRQAIDGMIAGEVDPNTIRVLTQARQAVDGELATAVPGIKAVDAQFAELSRQSAGLQRGSNVLDKGKEAIRPVELVDEMAQGALPQGTQVGPSAAPLRVKQGTRAEIDRQIGTNVNDLGALERTMGTPQDWNSQKLGTIFGEGPRDRVAKALMDNRQFRQSYQDIVQGSQTAQRTASANAMEGAAGGNVPHDTTVTGIGLKALNLVSKAISGASTARTKDEIGNILAKQGPEVQRIARALLDSAKTTGENSRAINRVLSSPYWISATAPVSGRKATQ